MSEIDVLVLNQPIHGMSPREYRSILADRLPERRVELASKPSEYDELVAQSRIVTGFEIGADAVESADDLELFACTFAGTDHLPTDAFQANDVRVTNASGVHGPPAAEQVMAYVLSFARHLDTGWDRSRDGTWSHYRADELQGSTVTVVGTGAIGGAILDRLAPFGVDTIGVRNTPSKGGPADEIIGFDEFEERLPETDYLALACPLTEKTEGLVDESAFDLLDPSSVLVNIARGEVVETDALVSALKTNELRGAALDVTDPEPLPDGHPLWNLDNCLVTPHNAGHTPEYWDRMADIIAENVERLESGEELRNLAQ
ncbi:D-2-hydroxyacid dehydrogenase [Halomicroarcula limicola]|uniref:D-2-hydroxyacid dehydrogenase n=1 Tax=Haloarcula limicola TaxID=1429915 RepID=A0A8J7YAJ0_9EURY|nr:D-2-hydroxyacid dehydrogenase [Halomicroarcula limicola]MBV0923691.1 D-2-hydroxyacid dehydrogenase [Halomicroarcula limicola]